MKIEQMRLVLDDDKYETSTDSVVRVDKFGKVKDHKVIKNNEVVEIKRRLTEKQIYKINQNKYIKEYIQANEGSYFHSIYKYCYPYMMELQDNIDIIRIIILATYLSFGGKLFDKNNNRIKKSSLKHIWDTSSRNSINKTYNKLKDVCYIYETEEGYIMINQELFTKGKVDNFNDLKKQDDNFTYTRLFAENIQDMYYNCKDSERKRLAYFFKILPFINFKYNVLCMNPREVNETNLQLYNWKDLALICGVAEKNATRLKRDLMKLRIYGFEVIGQFETGSGKAIAVNPKVFYSGNDISEVKHLYAMFRMCDKNNKN